MDGAAGVLDGREAEDVRAAGLRVHPCVRPVHGERSAGALRVQAGAAEERAAGAAGAAGDVRQRQGLHVRVHARLGHGFAIHPIHLLGVQIPRQGGAPFALGDDVLAGLHHRHAGGEGGAAAAGDVAKASALGVAHMGLDLLVRNAQRLRRHQRHAGARAADVRAALHHGDHAVLGDAHFRARLHADVEPEAHRHAAPGAFGNGLQVVRMLLGGAQAFLQADGRERGPVRRLRAFVGGVLEAQVDGIHRELAGEFVDGAFHGVHGLRRPRRAVGAHLGLGHQHVVAFDHQVRHFVGCQHGHAAGADGSAGEGARLVRQPSARGGEGAVLLGADLHLAPRGGGGAGGAEHFLAAHRHLHRPAGQLREFHRQRLQVDGRLAAEAAADFGRNHLDVAHAFAEHAGGERAHVEGALGATPDGRLAVRVHGGGAGVRLDVALVGGGHPMFALDDDVRFLEAFVDVAAREALRGGDVARRFRGVAVGVLVLVHQGGACRHGVFQRQHRV